MSATFQPRYVVYAAQFGKTPEQMLEFDRERFPGGHMAGFMNWISDSRRAWASERGGMPDVKTQTHHDDFDAWLATRSQQMLAA